MDLDLLLGTLLALVDHRNRRRSTTATRGANGRLLQKSPCQHVLKDLLFGPPLGPLPAEVPRQLLHALILCLLRGEDGNGHGRELPQVLFHFSQGEGVQGHLALLEALQDGGHCLGVTPLQVLHISHHVKQLLVLQGPPLLGFFSLLASVDTLTRGSALTFSLFHHIILVNCIVISLHGFKNFTHLYLNSLLVRGELEKVTLISCSY